ncbi:hypothetical protein [Edaphobacter aggregans]|uniref:hypothetical protein n=1 Tax=Edaphobacter aggregans TaxID=570835 RepID=UPI001FDFE9ED|nr:hypothetical protein [Edaphobacter aggregans]
MAIPIPGQAAFTQSQPEATFGIARQRNWNTQPLVCNLGGESAILNLDQSTCISGTSANDYGPNAAIQVLDHPQNDPNGASVATLDGSKPAALVNKQSIIQPDPKPSSMVFEKGRHATARQSILWTDG